MANSYHSVLEMAKANLPSGSVQRLGRHLEEHTVSSALCVLRCSKGMTQEQLAKKMGMTPHQIAVQEDSSDFNINMPYLSKFANAFDMKVTIIFDPQETDPEETIAVHAIKQHVFQIQHYLNKLTNLVQDDKAIRTGVDSFYKEYLFNILRLFLGSFNNLQGQNIEEETISKIANFLQELTTNAVDEIEGEGEVEEPFVVQPQKLYGGVIKVVEEVT